ncbi:flagellar hook protein FlgE [Alsobacter sp. SYSU M60028]|uniref:Flagellar hook protein FlgE n=1 Tax=Alsobacter ponti TaxID=2962936 RepID=A0ABT1L8A3_9HYPH|nr:flagellar hook protein FlgE [Alsobacter ponti]MCP8937301.1 flagellar hook protein FlgE [Alsobacter ponti]
MSVFGAMNTAVAGLRAQSFALENISDNIANSQTTGYKRVDTSFMELVPDFPLNSQIGGSVMSFSRGTNTLAGNITSTGVGTNFALSGEGYVVVRDRVSYSAGVPVFAAQDLYTRRGDFERDKNGYLVNGAGNYLVGYAADPTTGVISSGAPDVLRFTDDQFPAKATSSIEYKVNLPSYPKTSNASTATANSELIVTPPAVPPATVASNAEQAFLDRTVSGGSMTVYDDLGTPITLQLRWGKTDSVANGGVDTWNVYYMNDSSATAATAPAVTKWTNLGTNFTFDSTGQLTSGSTATLTAPTIDGTTLGNITMNFGTGGLTQFADISGQIKSNTVRPDGYAAGTLDGITINDSGQIMAAYSNGQTRAVAQIAVAQFSADNALKRLDGGAFAETLESGPPTYANAGVSFISGSLEGSNTDIAEEFSKMIITQQAYSANTRVVSTSQQMLQDAINIIR